MNEQRKAGRPRKHLEDEHHFRTSDEVAAAGVPPASTESDQTDATSDSTESPSASAELIEAMIENPIVVSGTGSGATASVTVEDGCITSVTLTSHSQPPYYGDTISVDQESDKKNLNGWHPIESATVANRPPTNGMAVRLAKTPEDDGVLGFWKKTRAFNGKRYSETGVWLDFSTGQKISFEPKYWKERF